MPWCSYTGKAIKENALLEKSRIRRKSGHLSSHFLDFFIVVTDRRRRKAHAAAILDNSRELDLCDPLQARSTTQASKERRNGRFPQQTRLATGAWDIGSGC